MLYFISIFSLLYSITLQEAFDTATPYGDYDKYIILNQDSIYYGGLGLYEGNIYIEGNGSIIDLDQGNGIWVYGDDNYPCNLDISYTTVINGAYFGISFGGTATGTIRNCNLINNDMGIKLFDNSNTNIFNCNFVNNITYGLGVYTEDPVCNISYCNSWGNGEYDYMENCPG